MILGVPILKHFRVHSTELTLTIPELVLTELGLPVNLKHKELFENSKFSKKYESCIPYYVYLPVNVFLFLFLSQWGSTLKRKKLLL